MSINLIAIDQDLKSIPATPQGTQALISYANGMNPMVPPFLALAELKLRSSMGQQQAQAPQATVKDQVTQQAGLGMLQHTLSQQMQPQMPMNPATMQASAAQAQPQQPQQQPVGMARGGIAELDVDENLMRFGSGGVIAFRKGDEVEVEEEEDDGAETDEGYVPLSGVDAKAEFEALKPQLEAAAKRTIPTARSSAAIETSLGGKKGYGIAEGPIGQQYLQGIEDLMQRKNEDAARRQKELAVQNQLALFRGLSEAGEASRGQRGLGALMGGFGRSYGKSAGDIFGQMQELRQEPIKNQELLEKAKYEIQELRRATLNKDVAAQQKAEVELAKIAKDMGVSLNTLLGRQYSGIAGLLGREASARGTVEAARLRANRPFAPRKPSELDDTFNIELEALRAAGADVTDPAVRQQARTIALRKHSKTAGTERVEITAQEKADEAFYSALLTGPKSNELRRLKREDPNAYNIQVDLIQKEIEAKYGVRPRMLPQAQPKAAPAPKAAGTLPPAAVAKLKEGEVTTFANGQRWTLENGQPKQVK